MKKKIFALLMVICLVFTMAAGCGSASDAGNDAGGDQTETPTGDQQTDGSEESDDGMNGEDASEGTDDSLVKSETSDIMLTADTEITDEDIQKIYASIKESIITEYLEPNGIDPVDFSWSVSSEAWSYLVYLFESYYMELFTGVEMDTSSTENLPPSPEKEIMDSIFTGMLNGLDNLGKYDADYYNNFTQRLNPFNTNITNNVTFE